MLSQKEITKPNVIIAWSNEAIATKDYLQKVLKSIKWGGFKNE